MKIRAMVPGDGPAVLAVYAEGISGGNATFETLVPTWAAFDEVHVKACRFVAELDGKVVGWAALTPSSQRCAYVGVADVSVYVASQAQGQGIGSALLSALVVASEDGGFWTLTAGIFRSNQASIRLHLKHGFRLMGYNERVGQLHGEWRDVMRLERRSTKIGK